MKLLYAEDEPAMAEAVTDILNCHNFMVDAVQDGQEALDYARSGDYDGIILDIMLPKKSGLEVLSELRESGDRTPVLLLTAKSEVEDRILGLDLGADDYLPKPFAMGELLARVRAMLRRRKFVVTAMAGVTLLLLVLLGGINGVNLWLNSRDTDMLLNALADGEGTIRPERGGPGFFGPPLDGDDAMSAVFFIVRLDADGSAVYADTSRISTVTEDEAVEYAESAAAAGDASGREGRFRYRIAPSRDGRGSVAVFLDVSADERSMLIVAVLSLLAGAACWLAALLAAVLLSRRATRPIAESMERQKQFITDAGHEIKTPLAIIRANADALELHQGESRWSRNIQRQTERMDELMKRLLTLARLDEGGAAKLVEMEFDVSALVEETAAQFREPAEAAGLRLSCEIEPSLHTKGVPEQLAELAGILLDNAVKYSAPGGEINLALRRESGRVTLRIRNACAEPPEEPERLFDRFYRGDSARTQSTGGTGLGLSIARALAENMGASLAAARIGETEIEFTARLH